jgi:hypothetical protein
MKERRKVLLAGGHKVVPEGQSLCENGALNRSLRSRLGADFPGISYITEP